MAGRQIYTCGQCGGNIGMSMVCSCCRNSYTPTPETIEAEALELQAKWTPNERRRRHRHKTAVPVDIARHGDTSIHSVHRHNGVGLCSDIETEDPRDDSNAYHELLNGEAMIDSYVAEPPAGVWLMTDRGRLRRYEGANIWVDEAGEFAERPPTMWKRLA